MDRPQPSGVRAEAITIDAPPEAVWAVVKEAGEKKWLLAGHPPARIASRAAASPGR